jgi:hypothetical protein
MKRLFVGLAFALLLTAVTSVWAEAPLPIVPDVPYEALRQQADELQKTLARLQASLRRQTRKELEEVLKRGTRAPEESVARIQRLLDPYCLVGVTINPESRVKAARGPAPATLALDRKTYLLIKVANEGGVTHGLQISGTQLATELSGNRDRWLEAGIESCLTMEKRLTGQKLEYVILGLRARQRGNREATLRFDVGQGTQDLGFRAEVPVLFFVR